MSGETVDDLKNKLNAALGDELDRAVSIGVENVRAWLEQQAEIHMEGSIVHTVLMSAAYCVFHREDTSGRSIPDISEFGFNNADRKLVSISEAAIAAHFGGDGTA